MSSNQLKTFHKDTFRDLNDLASLDLSMNSLDYLPHCIFDDLHGLQTL